MDNQIDMVYLWCDGSDPEFAKRKLECQRQLGISDGKIISEVAGNKRFCSNDELKYSLRSLEKYVPWINHVYIVTDRQVPKWLNTDYEKVTVVDHSEIMPQEVIPCFNSVVIEYFLHNIPGLSKKFLYSNDDMFFGGVVSPEDFFVEEKPILRVKDDKHVLDVERSKSTFHQANLMTVKKVEELYGKKYLCCMHHCVDAYDRDTLKYISGKYRSLLECSYGHKFRQSDEITRIFFHLVMASEGKGIVKYVNDPPSWRKHLRIFGKPAWFSYCGDICKKTCWEIETFNPTLFCVNTTKDDADFGMIQNLLERLFPRKSNFEI